MNTQTITTDKSPCPGGNRTHNPSRRTIADLRLWPRSHWDRHKELLGSLILWNLIKASSHTIWVYFIFFNRVVLVNLYLRLTKSTINCLSSPLLELCPSQADWFYGKKATSDVMTSALNRLHLQKTKRARDIRALEALAKDANYDSEMDYSFAILTNFNIKVFE